MPRRPTHGAAELWARVHKTEDCWRWMGPVHPNGLPLAFYEGIRESAGRIAWRIAHGHLDEGSYVRRHCSNRLCVRPDHLYLRRVEPADLLREYLAGGVTHEHLAARYGVDRSHVTRLIQRARKAVGA